MKRSVVALSLIVACAVSSAPWARAACDPNGADAADVAAARAAVAANCDCAGATSHGAYVSCAGTQASATLVNQGCLSTVKRCASRSTCGRPGYVTCCRTNARGVTKCSIKKTAAKCKAPHNGSACAGVLSSCCDACQAGGCVTPTTSSSTSTSVTSSTCTSTTTFPPCQSFGGGSCGGACSIGQTCQSDGLGGCSCVGLPVACDMTNHSVCSTGVCPVGETCTFIVDNPQCGIVHCGCNPTPTTTSSTSTSVTSSTCTSTTTFPPCQLFGATCGGQCPVGQLCQDNGVGGCTCVGPPASCAGSGPSFCATGVCPAGQTCNTHVGFCGTIFCGCD